MEITQDYIKSLLKYDKETGEFCWLVAKSTNIKIGKRAGNKTKSGYRVIKINRKLHLSHRLAWLYIHGYMPRYIDHLNRVRDDNRLCNLRDCTQSENILNVGVKKHNTSGYKGVYFHRGAGKWQAQGVIRGEHHYLGLFTTVNEAVKARKLWELLNYTFINPLNEVVF